MSSATRKTKASAGQTVKASAKSLPFIQGPVADGFWIIGSPLVALAAMGALWRWSGASDFAVYSILFGFIVTGHHLPGWFRAFGEPAVYQRFKARLSSVGSTVYFLYY